MTTAATTVLRRRRGTACWNAPSRANLCSGAQPKLCRKCCERRGDRCPPEIILDSPCPGPDGRWSVRVEQQQAAKQNKKRKQKRVKKKEKSDGQWWNFDPPPPLQPAASEDCETSDDGGSPMAAHKLWSTLWGPNPPPRNLQTCKHDINDSTRDKKDNVLKTPCTIWLIGVQYRSMLMKMRSLLLRESTSRPSTKLRVLNLARGNFQVAARMFHVLQRSLDAMAEMTPDLRFAKGANLHNIGILQLWAGQYEKAVETFQLAVAERVTQLPPFHPDIVVSFVRKADACFGAGRLEEAKAALISALPMIPPDHICLAKTLNNLGVIFCRQNDTNSALKNFTKSLEIQRLWLDRTVRRETTVFDAAVTLLNTGRLYLERSDSDLAVSMFEEALLLQTRIFGKDHDMVLVSRMSLGVAKQQNGDLNNAQQIFLGCLRSQDKRFGPMSPAAIETLGLSGCLYAKQGDFEHALNCFSLVRKWQKSNLSENHPAVRRSREIVRAIEANKQGPGGGKIWI